MTKWVIDPAHTSVNFSVRHLMISKVRGQFNEFQGEIDGDVEDFENATIHFKIETDSINTNQEQRDGHLKSADFFDVEKYPQITFKSTTIEQTKANHFNIVGEMTIKDVTGKVTFHAVREGVAQGENGRIAGFHASAEINRQDYGLTWQQALETGGVMVGNTVSISVDFEAQEQ